MLTKEELATIRERAERATPGPWKTSQHDQYSLDIVSVPEQEVICWTDSFGQGARDGYFIAEAREDIPKLLAEVERLRRLVWVMNDEGEYRFGYAEWYDFHEGVNERLEGMRNE
ncbi:hypothetical protein M655_025105 [Brevibacillus sp. NSP2.1]|uniref:hypothetical protein n=1 Tax=Brevibacillus sp. NSP2.1 TaxID=3003229 RepID=UPI00041367B2|nr:hypothetical protein [Brevibacillus sp. NSP2.1]QHZ58649.1 hypothetical protein M655_025105 [Brevibacillus sp. NSP2.1]